MGKIAIIGGGAAGSMAGIRAAQRGLDVTVFERNEKIGKKLFITGKGRCNVTNACDTEEFWEHITGNKKFLYSAFYNFDNVAVMQMLEEAGCLLKTERGNRVFPISDHSSDVIQALKRELARHGCKVYYNTRIKSIVKEPGRDGDIIGPKKDADKETEIKGNNTDGRKFVIQTEEGKTYRFDSVILATGGKSYQSTGSTGDGYRFAKDFGHTVTELRPSLVPLKIKEEWCPFLEGLSLKNVMLTMINGKKKVYSEMGEMLFTAEGVSGPLVLTASAVYARLKDRDDVKLLLDLKPALSEEQFDKRLQREFEEGNQKQLKNILTKIYPSRLAALIPTLSDVDGDKKCNQISKEERQRIGMVTKNLTMTVTGSGGFDEAIITCGGVSLKEVNPSTMESKLVPGLYFAGEILDLDAHTGGYNLQIAWSTGCLAGDSV